MYFGHVLRSPTVLEDALKRKTGSAIRRIILSDLKKVKILLPSLEEQKRIADILDRAEALRAKRRAILAQLDELVQSIFIDMFGDPITNPKEWEICSIGALLTDVTNGLTRRRKGSDEGTDIVLRLRDIREGWIDFSDVNRISLSYQESSRYKISVNDLLFIRVNGNPDYVGRCALFEGFSEPVYFNDHIMRVKTDQSKVDGKFLVYMLNGPRGKREIALHRKTSAGQHTINQDGLGKIEIPLPPLKIQQEFAFRTASIEKLKTVHKASLAELDDLFSSLQYRAFRGELEHESH
ncbi:restriction endonuclease subunit S [Methanosarcina barkeri]|nr:restriction endonuclease subunit S [Methanosarcina barkeri]